MCCDGAWAHGGGPTSHALCSPFSSFGPRGGYGQRAVIPALAPRKQRAQREAGMARERDGLAGPTGSPPGRKSGVTFSREGQDFKKGTCPRGPSVPGIG